MLKILQLIILLVFSQELIALQGESKIHNDEVIMTCGMCPLVLAFLTKAAKQRKFHVIVAECAPKYDVRHFSLDIVRYDLEFILVC